MSILIISAVKFEAQPTIDKLTKHSVQVDFIECGIGPLNASRSVAKLKSAAKGKQVFYLGSAGTFGDFPSPFLCTTDEIHWMPTGERMGHAKFMETLHPPHSLKLPNPLNLPVVSILSSTSVSFSGEIALPHLPAPEKLVENMEAYCIARDLYEAADSLEIVMGITNQVGPQGSVQWSENFKSVAEMTANYMEKRVCL